MWAFAIKQKITVAVLLFMVIGLVILTNMHKQRTATKISSAVTSLYEDRLVVAEYILKLSKRTEGIIATLEKENGKTSKLVDNHLTDIAELNALYETTILTEIEKTNFEHFKQLCVTIAKNNKSGDHNAALLAARDVENTLQTLSSIQVDEGKNQLDNVLRMTYFSNLFSYVELGILIVIAVIIQVLVFASKTMMGNLKKPNHERLN